MNNSLSLAQREHFLDNGYVVVENAIPTDNLKAWQDLAWQRLGYDRDDASTWEKPRVHLPPSRAVRVRDFAPRAQAAMEELCGADRLVEPNFWGDVFIFNGGEGANEPFRPPAATAPGWHKDGFMKPHYLDSPEQGLLVLVAWTDVQSRGGATFIAPDSVGVIARFLAERPAGIEGREFGALIGQCQRFEQLTARAGDVILCHPFLLHAVSQNVRGIERIISNPIVMLREPMNFNRADGDYSLVEQSVLRALGRESFDFNAVNAQRTPPPDWVARAYRDLRESDSLILL